MEKFYLIAFNGSAQDIFWATVFALFGEPDIFFNSKNVRFFLRIG